MGVMLETVTGNVAVTGYPVTVLIVDIVPDHGRTISLSAEVRTIARATEDRTI
jgi:hypothetical protein